MICSPAGAHHRRWSLVILSIAIAVVATAGPWVRPSLGQTLGIPVEAKTANDMTSYRAGIEQKLAAAVTDLADPSADKQNKARLSLENETRIPGKSDLPSAAYLDVYTRTLNKLLDTIKANESVRIRMNAALATANIAQVADNDNLKDIVLVFVQDKNPAVCLWGIKAAKYIIPAQLRLAQIGPFNPALVNAIIAAVKTHTEGAIAGAIAAEAYDALTLDISNNPAALAKMKPVMFKTMAPFVLQLLQTRIAMYQKGVPPSPRADAWGTRFLSDPSVWIVLTPAQRKDAMQAFCNLVILAGKQAATANTGDKVDLAVTISRAASAISTVITDPALKAALDPLVKLQPQAPAAQIQQVADQVLVIVRKEKGFEGLADAPPITGHEAAPAPASAPTTGPVAIPGAGNPPPAGTPATPVPAPAPTPTPAPKPPAGGTTPKPPAPAPRPTAPPGGTARPPTNTRPPAAR